MLSYQSPKNVNSSDCGQGNVSIKEISKTKLINKDIIPNHSKHMSRSQEVPGTKKEHRRGIINDRKDISN